jgi:hypothetical protein
MDENPSCVVVDGAAVGSTSVDAKLAFATVIAFDAFAWIASLMASLSTPSVLVELVVEGVVVEGVVVVEVVEGVVEGVVEVVVDVIVLFILSFIFSLSSSDMPSNPSNIYIFDAIMMHNAASNPKVTLCIAKNMINAIKANLPKVLLYKLFNDLGLTINTIINNVNKKQSP